MDREVIEQKLESLRHCLRRIETKCPADAQILATGVQVSVREFVQRAAGELGITVTFSGSGTQEVGTVAAVSGDKAQCKAGDVIVRVDPRYFRPTEVATLLGDPGKAKRKLGWTPATTLAELVSERVDSDYAAAKRDSLVKKACYQAFGYHE